MTSPVKRKLSSTTRSVSPPTVRRRVELAVHAGASDARTSNVRRSSAETWTFYSWNVNGISHLLQKKISFSNASLYPLRSFLKDHQWPHLLCLQEVKIRPDDEATKRRVESAANAGCQQREPMYTAYFSLPRDKYNAKGFGGKVHGVATLVRQDTAPSQVSLPDFDLEGRVLVHEFVALPLVVVNGYWVNGTDAPYRDPSTGEPSGTRHDHKLWFHARMLDLCKAAEARGKHVVLLGDMNVAPKRHDGHPNLRTSPVQHVKNRADFNAKFLDKDSKSGLRGVDVFRHFHGDEKKFTYRGRGRPWGESADRVDLIIASHQLTTIGAVTATDICDNPRDRGHSDHVPLWVAIDQDKLWIAGADKMSASSEV